MSFGNGGAFIGGGGPPAAGASMTVGGSIGGGTATRIPFEDVGPVLADNANLTFDKTTGTVSASALVLSSATAPVSQSTITDSSAATQIEADRLRHLASVTATAGIGVYQSFWASNGVSGGGTLAEAARVKGALRGVSNGAENGFIEFMVNAAGTMGSAAHISGTSLFGSTAIGVGTVSATGTTTSALTITGNSGSMVAYVDGNASTGGHAFSGTVNTAGARSFLILTPSANTGITASTERITYAFGSAHSSGVPGLTSIIHTWATGAITTQRDAVFVAPTYAFAASSTITNAATLAIVAAPIAGTNATITNSFALWVQAGAARIDGVLDLSGIAAGTSNVKITKTSDTPTTTFSAANATNAAPSGFIEITEGGTSKYIPFYT